MIDELELLKHLVIRDDLPPSTEARLRARQDLGAAMLTPAVVADTAAIGTPRSGWRHARWDRLPAGHRRWPLAVGAVAVVAAVATVVATVALPTGNPAGPTPAAAAVLDQAAQRAAALDTPQPGPGQYLYVETIIGTHSFAVQSAPGKAPKVTSEFGTAEIQQWIAPDGKGREVTRLIRGNAPVTQGPMPVGKIGSGQTPILKDNAGPGTLLYPDANLPTNSEDLNQTIVSRYENGRAEEAMTFQLAGGFLQETASPALRAALYRVVADLPGVTPLGYVTDRLRRRGVGVALLSGGIRYELIFNPQTSAVLQAQQVAVDPPVSLIPFPMQSGTTVSIQTIPTPKITPGTVMSYTLYESTGIVDSATAVPPSS